MTTRQVPEQAQVTDIFNKRQMSTLKIIFIHLSRGFQIINNRIKIVITLAIRK